MHAKDIHFLFMRRTAQNTDCMKCMKGFIHRIVIKMYRMNLINAHTTVYLFKGKTQ